MRDQLASRHIFALLDFSNAATPAPPQKNPLPSRLLGLLRRLSLRPQTRRRALLGLQIRRPKRRTHRIRKRKEKPHDGHNLQQRSRKPEPSVRRFVGLDEAPPLLRTPLLQLEVSRVQLGPALAALCDEVEEGSHDGEEVEREVD